MSRKPREHEELPERSRETARYGEQGLAIPTYGAEEEDPQRGVAVVNLGEPAAREVRGVLVDVLRRRRAATRLPK